MANIPSSFSRDATESLIPEEPASPFFSSLFIVDAVSDQDAIHIVSTGNLTGSAGQGTKAQCAMFDRRGLCSGAKPPWIQTVKCAWGSFSCLRLQVWGSTYRQASQRPGCRKRSRRHNTVASECKFGRQAKQQSQIRVLLEALGGVMFSFRISVLRLSQSAHHHWFKSPALAFQERMGVPARLGRELEKQLAGRIQCTIISQYCLSTQQPHIIIQFTATVSTLCISTVWRKW